MLEPENDLAQEASEGGGYNCSELAGRRPLRDFKSWVDSVLNPSMRRLSKGRKQKEGSGQHLGLEWM